MILLSVLLILDAVIGILALVYYAKNKEYCTDPDKGINPTGDCICRFGVELNGECQCPKGQIRKNDSCFQGCESSVDCPAGQICTKSKTCCAGIDCGGQCCEKDSCVQAEDGTTFCCASSDRLKKNKDGKIIGCCPTGTRWQLEKNACIVDCGDLACDAGESCFSTEGDVENLKALQTSLNKMGIPQTKIALKNNVLQWCGKQQSGGCSIGDSFYQPAATTKRGDIFYSCWNPNTAKSITDKSNDSKNLPLDYNICVPTDPKQDGDYLSCAKKLRDQNRPPLDISECKDGCELMNVAHLDWSDSTNDRIKKAKKGMAVLSGISTDLEDYQGHYCGGEGQAIRATTVPLQGSDCSRDKAYNLLLTNQGLHSNALFPYIGTDEKGNPKYITTIYSCHSGDSGKLQSTPSSSFTKTTVSNPDGSTQTYAYTPKILPTTTAPATTPNSKLQAAGAYQYADKCEELGLPPLTNYCVWPEDKSPYKECPAPLRFLEEVGTDGGDQNKTLENCTPNQPGVFSTNLCRNDGAIIYGQKSSNLPPTPPKPRCWYFPQGKGSNEYCLPVSDPNDACLKGGDNCTAFTKYYCPCDDRDDEECVKANNCKTLNDFYKDQNSKTKAFPPDSSSSTVSRDENTVSPIVFSLLSVSIIIVSLIMIILFKRLHRKKR